MKTRQHTHIQLLTIVGVLLFMAGFISLMGIITAEIYYPPGYSTAQSEISDLGSTRPPRVIIHQPSATIFNSVMIATGIITLTAATLLFCSGKDKLVSVCLLSFGVGICGVGVFPGNTSPHPWFSLLTFFSGGIGAVISAVQLKGGFRYISITLGTCSLLFLLFASRFIPLLGDGGTERWVAYPLILWLVGLGGYYMGISEPLSVKSKL